MDRTTRLGRIAAKMGHPSMNVKQQFHLLTDKLVDVERRAMPHTMLAVSVSPEETPEQKAHREWVEDVRVNYKKGLLD